jgi:hypothetical protein
MKRNTLKITNLDYLLEFDQKDDYYKSPIEILAELEKEIKYLNHVQLDTILIDYKPGGYAIFDFHSFKKEDGIITYYFEFTGFAS